MIVITKSMIALSAVISAAAIAAVGTSASNPSAAAQVSGRFPAQSEMFRPVSVPGFVAQKLKDLQAQGRKGDRLPSADAAKGAVPKVDRVVPTQRRIANGPVRVAEFAQR